MPVHSGGITGILNSLELFREEREFEARETFLAADISC